MVLDSIYSKENFTLVINFPQIKWIYNTDLICFIFTLLVRWSLFPQHPCHEFLFSFMVWKVLGFGLNVQKVHGDVHRNVDCIDAVAKNNSNSELGSFARHLLSLVLFAVGLTYILFVFHAVIGFVCSYSICVATLFFWLWYDMMLLAIFVWLFKLTSIIWSHMKSEFSIRVFR